MHERSLPLRKTAKIELAGTWSLAAASDTATLPHAQRQGRVRIATDRGAPVLLIAPKGVLLVDGDGLVLDDNRRVMIRRALEPCLRVNAPDPALLLRLAWHCGARGVAMQNDTDTLLLADTRSNRALVTRYGCLFVPVFTVFDPEIATPARPAGPARRAKRSAPGTGTLKAA